MSGTRIAPATAHVTTWSSLDPRDPARCVLLLIDHTAPSRAAVTRACRLSRSLDAPLQIIDVVPPTHDRPDGATVISRALHRDGTRCAVEVTNGNLREIAHHAIAHYAPSVVVVDGGRGGDLACELVDRGRVPVIVAREERRRGPFIAASDMESAGFPVVTRAVELAESCARDLTLFHNASAYPALASDPMEPATRYASLSDLLEASVAAKVTRLRGIAGSHDHVDAVIARSHDTEAAVLDLAHERDADLLIVGRRARSWLWRVLGHHLSQHLIERSRRSVMVVPVAAVA